MQAACMLVSSMYNLFYNCRISTFLYQEHLIFILVKGIKVRCQCFNNLVVSQLPNNFRVCRSTVRNSLSCLPSFHLRWFTYLEIQIKLRLVSEIWKMIIEQNKLIPGQIFLFHTQIFIYFYQRDLSFERLIRILKFWNLNCDPKMLQPSEVVHIEQNFPVRNSQNPHIYIQQKCPLPVVIFSRSMYAPIIDKSLVFIYQIQGAPI